MKFSVFLCLLFLISSCQKNISKDSILFNSNRNGNSDIFIMKGDGSEVKKLVSSANDEWAAVFKDEQTMSFLRQVQDSVKRFELNLMSLEEKELIQPNDCYLDDKNVVYSSLGDYVYSCQKGLFLVRKNKDTSEKLISTSSDYPKYLSWTKDGKEVVYTQKINGQTDIYSINIETLEIKNLTNSPSNDERGELSTNKNLLLFSSNRHDKKDQDLFILNLKTGESKNITNSKGYDPIGRWSKNNKSIYFGSNQSGNWEIYKIDLVENITLCISNNPNFDGDPRVQ